MSMPTLMPTRTHVESPTNKVIRRWAITPINTTINGHRVDVAECIEVALRHTELEAANLHRESKAAVNEALDFARRRGMLPKGVEASAVCILESLRRA